MAQYFEGRRSVAIHHDQAVSEMLPPGPIRLRRLTRVTRSLIPKLDRADAIAADRLEQRERLGVPDPQAPAEALADASLSGSRLSNQFATMGPRILREPVTGNESDKERTLSDWSQELV